MWPSDPVKHIENMDQNHSNICAVGSGTTHRPLLTSPKIKLCLEGCAVTGPASVSSLAKWAQNRARCTSSSTEFLFYNFIYLRFLVHDVFD